MIHAAHASRYHWGEVGEPVNLARGRVAVLAGLRGPGARRAGAVARPALPRDQRGERRSRRLGLALGVRGDGPGQPRRRRPGRGRRPGRRRAIAALDGIADPDDREIIESDIATLP